VSAPRPANASVRVRAYGKRGRCATCAETLVNKGGHGREFWVLGSAGGGARWGALRKEAFTVKREVPFLSTPKRRQQKTRLASLLAAEAALAQRSIGCNGAATEASREIEDVIIVC